MERKLCFISDDSAILAELVKEFETGLSEICEVQTCSLQEAYNAALPEALILPYRKTYIDNPDFQRLAKQITERFSKEGAEDLRVYVFPADLSEEQFMSIQNSNADEAIEELRDVVQVVPDRDLERLINEIKDYFDTRDEVRKKRKKNQRKHIFQWVVGLAATALTALSILYILAYWIYFKITAGNGYLLPLFGRTCDPLIIRLTWFTSWVMILSCELPLRFTPK